MVRGQTVIFGCWLWLLGILAPVALWAGTATLSWDPPTTNTDGSELTDLAGFRAYWGCGGQFALGDDVADPNLRTLVVSGLPDVGSCEFFVTAYTLSGVESTPSNIATKNMGAAGPAPPATLSVTSADVFAYTVVQAPGRVSLVPVGTVPVGTPCDTAYSVNGRYAVPVDAVTYPPGSTVRPVVVFASCGGG